MDLTQLNTAISAHSFKVTITCEDGTRSVYTLKRVTRLGKYFRVQMIDIPTEEVRIFTNTAHESGHAFIWQLLVGKNPHDDREIYRGFFSLTGLNVDAIE